MNKTIIFIILANIINVACAQSFKTDLIDLKAVNGEEILGKIQSLPLGTCTLNGKRCFAPGHLDWYQAFGRDANGLIGNDTLFELSDRIGVLAVAIKTLDWRWKEMQPKIDQQTLLISQMQDNENENRRYRETVEQLLLRISQIEGSISDLRLKIEQMEQSQKQRE